MSKPLSIQYTGKYANHLLREKDKEIERLNNIIKEVREYIDRRDIEWGSDEHKQVLEILDKADKEKDNE